MFLSFLYCYIYQSNFHIIFLFKSISRFYVEGISIHVLSLIWIVTICIVTMPGGAASLLGNLYFTTWSTLFSVIGTLIWYVRDWRQMILDVIEEKEQEYELVKKTLRRREEERRARLKEKEREEREEREKIQHEETKAEESVVLCEDDPDVDDDITISISSGVWRGKSSVKSVTASPDRSRKEDQAAPPQDIVASSIFMSALSFLWTGPDVDLSDDEDK